MQLPRTGDPKQEHFGAGFQDRLYGMTIWRNLRFFRFFGTDSIIYISVMSFFVAERNWHDVVVLAAESDWPAQADWRF